MHPFPKYPHLRIFTQRLYGTLYLYAIDLHGPVRERLYRTHALRAALIFAELYGTKHRLPVLGRYSTRVHTGVRKRKKRGLITAKRAAFEARQRRIARRAQERSAHE